LEGAGLVERRPDPADRRARRVAVTDTGLSRLRELKDGLHHVEDSLLGPLADDERVVLRTLLQRVATKLAPANPGELAREFVETASPGLPVRPRRRHTTTTRSPAADRTR